MAFIFDATDGGPLANSYASVQFADDYFAAELYAAEWLALSNSVSGDLVKKQAALVKATRRLEKESWKGFRSSYSGQRLKHPRGWLIDDDGYWMTSQAVIEPIKHATCVLALFYLQNDPSQFVDYGLQQFDSLSIAGAIDLKMRGNAPTTDPLPDEVMNLVYRWLNSGPGQVRLSRA
jgi:hypothetical protein